MTYLKSLFGLAVAAFVAVGFMAQASAQEIFQQLNNESLLHTITKRGVLTVAHGSFVPWAFRSVKGDYVGFEIDIGKKLAEDMGVEYRNIPTPGDGIIPGLLAGKFDIILGGMTPTPKRALSVSFSNSYSPALSVGFSVNRKLAAGLSTIEDFNTPNVKIVSRRASVSADAAMFHFPKAKNLYFDDDATALQEVLNGNAHALLALEPKPTFWSFDYQDVLMKPFPEKPFSNGVGAGVAMRPGDVVFLTYINNWINHRSKVGFIQERFDYWFTARDWIELDPKRKK